MSKSSNRTNHKAVAVGETVIVAAAVVGVVVAAVDVVGDEVAPIRHKLVLHQ